MQSITRFVPPLSVCALAAALLPLLADPARAQGAADHIDVTAVTVEGASAEQCAERTMRLAWQSRALSLATSPPYDLSEGLRTFYDHVLRLDPNGELSSTAQLSTVYATGYTVAGERMLRAVTPFIRVEVARPSGTPAGAPSRLAISWLWLQRLAQATDAAGRAVERPSLHRFDVVGEVETTYGTWGHAVAPCRVGSDGLWFGAVVVWSYLAP
ncbi:hypothetical protein [Neoroseomonas soli]|uniref:Uncharacterized protein n=1 Tax=Neoroseomonas soli TaxID=1081025 RepID=A0A9X9WYD2_9PROT|nr:hypothetical protein [Neoroseomonas soli]MBR0672161.1 hypothetical protein [Neoroseomonas soli]